MKQLSHRISLRHCIHGDVPNVNVYLCTGRHRNTLSTVVMSLKRKATSDLVDAGEGYILLVKNDGLKVMATVFFYLFLNAFS